MFIPRSITGMALILCAMPLLAVPTSKSPMVEELADSPHSVNLKERVMTL